MKTHHSILASVAALALVGISAARARAAGTGDAALNKLMESATPLLENEMAVLRQTPIGDVEKAHASLVQRAKAHANRSFPFIVGNTLYLADPEGSLELLTIAQKEFPDSSQAAMELAYGLVRKRDCANAKDLIETWATGRKTPPAEARVVFHLFRAICAIENRDAKTASAAWAAADVAKNRDHVLRVLDDVSPAKATPAAERLARVAELKKTPDLAHAFALLKVGLTRGDDGEMASANWVADDSAYARSLLKDKGDRECLEKLADAISAGKTDGLKKWLSRPRGLLGKPPGLMASSLATRILIEQAIALKLVSLSALKKDLVPLLWKRALSETTPASERAHDLNAIAYVAIAQEPADLADLQKADLEGMRRTDDPVFAESALVQQESTSGKVDAVALKAAIARNPNSSILWALEHDRLKKDGSLKKDDLLSAIRAELRRPSRIPVDPPQQERLSLYFKELESKLQ